MIYKGRFIARSTGEKRVWLVLRSSVVETWGESPTKEDTK